MKIQYILSGLICLCLLIAPAAAAGGAGTSANPYVIQTPAELQSVQNDLSAYYVLGNDINMEGYNFVPIGSASAPFFGSLDGKGHTISNLNLQNPSSNSGLFSTITSNAYISNINFVDCSISSDDTGYLGIVFGRAIGGVTDLGAVIENINVVSCSVTSNTHTTGIIAGVLADSSMSTTLSHCTVSDCYVSGAYSVGGIVGRMGRTNSVSSIENCIIVDSAIICPGTSTDVGGLVGSGPITGSVGSTSNCSIINCSVSGGNYIGGFVGGGITGDMSSLEISDCSAINCIISGKNVIGGIVGRLAQTGAYAEIKNCNVDFCSIMGQSYIGGISGAKYLEGSGIIMSCNTNNSTIGAITSYAAGICPSFTRT